jgi:hypothetical protein
MTVISFAGKDVKEKDTPVGSCREVKRLRPDVKQSRDASKLPLFRQCSHPEYLLLKTSNDCVSILIFDPHSNMRLRLKNMQTWLAEPLPGSGQQICSG